MLKNKNHFCSIQVKRLTVIRIFQVTWPGGRFCRTWSEFSKSRTHWFELWNTKTIKEKRTWIMKYYKQHTYFISKQSSKELRKVWKPFWNSNHIERRNWLFVFQKSRNVDSPYISFLKKYNIIMVSNKLFSSVRTKIIHCYSMEVYLLKDLPCKFTNLSLMKFFFLN